jgi:hypothetical protein
MLGGSSGGGANARLGAVIVVLLCFWFGCC